jgi:Fur family ferric uptake transcriptional regulator
MEAPQTAAMRLGSVGLRPTAIRLAVLDVLQTMPHAGVPEIAEAVQQVLGTASRQAVYDALDQLLLVNLVRRIEPAGSPARYEVRVGDNHHHVVCRRCGRAADVDCAVGEAPCLEPSQTHGFVLDEAEVTFWGFCPDCHHTEDEDG